MTAEEATLLPGEVVPADIFLFLIRITGFPEPGLGERATNKQNETGYFHQEDLYSTGKQPKELNVL